MRRFIEEILHKQGICCGKRHAKGQKWHGAEKYTGYYINASRSNEIVKLKK